MQSNALVSNKESVLKKKIPKIRECLKGVPRRIFDIPIEKKRKIGSYFICLVCTILGVYGFTQSVLPTFPRFVITSYYSPESFTQEIPTTIYTNISHIELKAHFAIDLVIPTYIPIFITNIKLHNQQLLYYPLLKSSIESVNGSFHYFPLTSTAETLLYKISRQFYIDISLEGFYMENESLIAEALILDCRVERFLLLQLVAEFETTLGGYINMKSPAQSIMIKVPCAYEKNPIALIK